MRLEHYVSRKVGAKTSMGFQYVRFGRGRVYFSKRDVGNCDRDLQNGRQRYENARRRIDARETNGENISTNGQKRRRPIVVGRIYRRCQSRSVDRTTSTLRSHGELTRQRQTGQVKGELFFFNTSTLSVDAFLRSMYIFPSDAIKTSLYL